MSHVSGCGSAASYVRLANHNMSWLPRNLKPGSELIRHLRWTGTLYPVSHTPYSMDHQDQKMETSASASDDTSILSIDAIRLISCPQRACA